MFNFSAKNIYAALIKYKFTQYLVEVIFK